MPDIPNNDNQKETYGPASPVKRILAWVGVVYMVAFVFLNVDPFFTGGGYLKGIAALMVCPGAVGLGIVAVWQIRQSDCTYARKASMVILAGACAVVCVVGLVQGVPALLAGLGVGA